MSQYSDMIRKQFGEGDAVRDAGLTTPEDVVRFDDIAYDTKDARLNLLDVYRPKGVEGKLPVIMNVHGGGWVYGDKEVYQFYCMSLAQRGFAVVNYSYRLAPEYKYPSPLEDTCTVAKWILDHAEKYGFDLDHIFAVGDSAGAHMLSLFACALTNPDYQVSYKVPADFKLQAIALNCGVYEMTPGALGDTEVLMNDFLPSGVTEQALDEISSAHHITENFPPCYIMTCPGDFLNAAPEALIPVLKKYNVPFNYRVYGNKNTPLAHVFHCNVRLPQAVQCNDHECNFFKEFLK